MVASDDGLDVTAERLSIAVDPSEGEDVNRSEGEDVDGGVECGELRDSASVSIVQVSDGDWSGDAEGRNVLDCCGCRINHRVAGVKELIYLGTHSVDGTLKIVYFSFKLNSLIVRDTILEPT